MELEQNELCNFLLVLLPNQFLRTDRRRGKEQSKPIRMRDPVLKVVYTYIINLLKRKIAGSLFDTHASIPRIFGHQLEASGSVLPDMSPESEGT